MVSPNIVVAEVLPEIDPGMIVQLPAGKPFNITLPVVTMQVGCVIRPTVGAGGDPGTEVITTFSDDPEIHPDASVTVYVNVVPAVSPVMVLLVPVPVVVPPGACVNVQVPVAGNPFNITPPVSTTQVGCVIAPTKGAGGATGPLITTLADAPEVHPGNPTVKV